MLPTTKYDIGQTIRDSLTMKLKGVAEAKGFTLTGPITELVASSHRDMVEKLFKKDSDQSMMLLHAVMGIAGEAGELVDAIKKHVFFGKELDKENVVEELGDILFYLEAMAQLLNVSKTQLMGHNVDKLLTGEKARHKSGSYSDEAQNARSDKQGVETAKSGVGAPPPLPIPLPQAGHPRPQGFPPELPGTAPVKAPEPQPIIPAYGSGLTADRTANRTYQSQLEEVVKEARAKFENNSRVRGRSYEVCGKEHLYEGLTKAVADADWASVVNYAVFLQARGEF